MKAAILLGTLKKTGLSNTQTLCEFFAEKAKQKNIDCEIIKLVDYNILPGTYSNMGEGDDWPGILQKITASDIVIFASPVWWGNHSSEIQRVIERLDELHDELMQGKKSRLEGKVGGVIATGDSDGAQNVIANCANFFNAIGLSFPPFATLTVLHSLQAKGKNATREQLMEVYEKDYSKQADRMIEMMMNR